MEEELKKELYEMQEREWEKELRKLKTYKEPVYRAILLNSLYMLARADPKKLDYLKEIVEKDVYIRDVDKELLLDRIERTRRARLEKKLEYVI
jgi:hypothetical protein